MDLNFKGYFISPIYVINNLNWVTFFNKKIKKEKNFLLIKNLKEYQNFEENIKKISKNVLEHIGYEISNFKINIKNIIFKIVEKNSPCFYKNFSFLDSHLSGFYFVKTSDESPFLIFKDPRINKKFIDLPIKNNDAITFSSDLVFYKPKIGDLFIFPSYLENYIELNKQKNSFNFLYFDIKCF